MTRHKKPDERRAQILDAARTCFIRSGYAQTRVDDIATEAGLSKGGVYFHFRSKRAIFDALFADQQERTAALVREVDDSKGSTIDKIARLAAGMVQNFSERDEHGKFLIVLAEMGIRDPEVHARVAGAHARYIEALARTIEEGIERGELRDVDPRMAALLMKFLVDGVEQGLALGYRFDELAFTTAGLDILFNGLSPK